MKKKLLGLIFCFILLNCFSQVIELKLTDINKSKIESILQKHYNYPVMKFEFNDGVNQTFFKNNGDVNLNKCLYIYIEYSDTTNNIRTGIKVFLIDVLTCKYKLYSEFWYVDFKKAGHKNYPGGMTNNGFGWVSKGENPKMDETVLKIANVIK